MAEITADDLDISTEGPKTPLPWSQSEVLEWKFEGHYCFVRTWERTEGWLARTALSTVAHTNHFPLPNLGLS